MIDKARRQWWLRSLMLAAPFIVASGCTEELGPERMEVARVKGFVTNGRLPVRSGWIEFIPVDGTVGNPCSARIHEDGSFDAPHVAVGTDLIRLAHVSLRSVDAERLFGAYHSPIRRVIPQKPTDPILVDVVQETIRYNVRRKGGLNLAPQNGGNAR